MIKKRLLLLILFPAVYGCKKHHAGITDDNNPAGIYIAGNELNSATDTYIAGIGKTALAARFPALKRPPRPAELPYRAMMFISCFLWNAVPGNQVLFLRYFALQTASAIRSAYKNRNDPFTSLCLKQLL